MKQLKDYNKKRDFKKTAEPEGQEGKTDSSESKFVIHMHQATRLHYDLRLELNGVLVSWAVPKGMPFSTKEKHLAMKVEDHPYDYRNFEGIIPEGSYGAGKVIIWDEGTFTTLGSDSKEDTEKGLEAGLKKGEIKVIFRGKKLKGQWALIRFKRAGENAWLVIKDRDEFANKPAPDDRSVRTGKNFDDMKPEDYEDKQKTIEPSTSSSKGEKGKKKVKYRFISPMLATLNGEAFNSPDWIFEIKWDGYRVISAVEKKNVTLYSRRGNSLNKKFPLIADELTKLDGEFILDGEVVAFNKKGEPDFSLIQDYVDSRNITLVYFVFDILALKDKYLMNISLEERKKILAENLQSSEFIKVNDFFDTNGVSLFSAVKKQGFEGIIAKKKHSMYLEGIRSDNWQKIKSYYEQEFIICGYLPSEKREIRSLMMGFYKKGELMYAGRVGTGFDDNNEAELLKILEKNKSAKPVFPNLDTEKGVVWIKPKLVCQIKFAEWTENDYIRQGVFMGLRSDKKPEEVVKESAH